jgi:hypothetical protein
MTARRWCMERFLQNSNRVEEHAKTVEVAVRLISTRTIWWMFLICCAGVAFADWLFYNQPAGINLVLFHLFLLFVAVNQTRVRPGSKPAFAILLLLAGLLMALGAQPGPITLFLFWLGLLAFVFTMRQRWSTNTVEWIARWLHFPVAFLFRIPRDFWLLSRWRSAGHGKNPFQSLIRLMMKWLLPVAGSLLFVWLFTLANPVLAYWFRQVEIFLQTMMDTFAITPDRVFFWGFVATTIWAVCRIRYKRRHFPEIGAGRTLSLSLLARCLLLFNAIFAVQSVLDFAYLWGGANLPGGMTYAEYAHRGAYPLIATALIAGLFVLLTFRAGLPTQETTLVRRLVYVWLAQNVLLTLNSLWRLHLYVEVYSLTRLRLAAAVWMLLVSAGIVLIVWRIYAGKSNAWLLNANFATLLGVLYLCCFINFDAMISRYNSRNCMEVAGKGVSLDIRYLEQIGVESLPALIWYQQNVNDPVKRARAQLATDRLIGDLEKDSSNWRAWTFRKHSLKKEVPHLIANRTDSGSHKLAGLSVLQIRD